MRLPRMTMRRWMITVLLIALVLGAIELLRRREQLRQIAVERDRILRSVRPRAQLLAITTVTFDDGRGARSEWR